MRNNKSYFWNQENIFLITMLLGMLVFVGFMPTYRPEGIIPLGEGKGVVLCGESITINADSSVTISDMYSMFEEAIFALEEECK